MYVHLVFLCMGGRTRSICVCVRFLILSWRSSWSISTLLRTCNRTHFRYPLKVTETCWRWLISWSNSSFLEQMAWALKTNVLSVPCFHAFGANDSQCNRYCYGWIFGVQWSQNCHHSSRSRCQERRFFH